MIRTLRRHFGISAPRLAVRTHVAWPIRVAWGLVLGGLIAALIWWGYDTGRLFAGFDRSEAAEERAKLTGELGILREEIAVLRSRAVQLESELSVAKGAQSVLSTQTLALQKENTHIKEDLVFLQKLFAGSGKEVALSIQRLQVERLSPTEYRVRMLVVYGGRKNEEFSGYAQLEARSADGRVLAGVPDQDAAAQTPLKLNFKYYQRVEASLQVPSGTLVNSIEVRVFENGNPHPRAAQTFSF